MLTLQKKIIQGLLYETFEPGSEETATEIENGVVGLKNPYSKKLE